MFHARQERINNIRKGKNGEEKGGACVNQKGCKNHAVNVQQQVVTMLTLGGALNAKFCN